MANFKYTAKDSKGKKVSGSIAGTNEGDATGKLRNKGLVVLSIKEEGAKVAKSGGGGLFAKKAPKARVKLQDMVLFTRQLATMVSAGIPLLEALEILAEQTEDPGFKILLDQVVADVRSGTDLSDAFGRHPKVFPKIYVNMVKAGEASGQLDDILDRLAEYQEATAKLQREIKSAMTYPVISLTMVIGITVFLMVFIIPKFTGMFKQMGVELPLPTVILIWVSDTMRAYFWQCGLIFAVVAVSLFYYSKTDMGRYQKDWLMLRLPVFGDLFQKVGISRFARTFSTLIQSGVPILGALEIVANTAGNQIVEDAVNQARESVRQGEQLAKPLMTSNVFPPMVTRMIEIGERAGALETLLEKISEFYDAEVEATVAALTSLIEPLMIGMMGLLVGGIVLAIFLPIFKMQGALAGGQI